MSIYILVMLSFHLLCWLYAFTNNNNTNSEMIVILIVIAASVLAVVFQSILL